MSTPVSFKVGGTAPWVKFGKWGASKLQGGGGAVSRKMYVYSSVSNRREVGIEGGVHISEFSIDGAEGWTLRAEEKKKMQAA